jgi:hypothetical protein
MLDVLHATRARCKDERDDQAEHKVLKGPWVMGDKYTIGNPYLFTIAS